MKAKIEREIDKMAEELQRLDKEVAAREELQSLAAQAPSVKEMRGAIAALFKEKDINPVKELIDLAQNGKLSDRDKAMIWKELAQYTAPKPKSVDVQADMNMSVTVGLQDFRNTSKAAVDVSHKELTDDSYAEFEQGEE